MRSQHQYIYKPTRILNKNPLAKFNAIIAIIGEKSIIESAQTLWGWKPEQGYGRMVLRGIRGTGLDVFKRF